ncbi:MAG: rod shape-determining protein MreD [Balneolaceae bacterium]
MRREANIRDLAIGLLLLAIQVVLLRHLQIFGAEGDLVLVYLLWICTRRNRTEAILYAALFGLLQDGLTDLWGLHTFSKTLLIFFVYNYLNKVSENRFLVWQVFLIVLVMAFFHNLILIFLSGFTELYSSSWLTWSILLVGSLYTALIGSFLYLIKQ